MFLNLKIYIPTLVVLFVLYDSLSTAGSGATVQGVETMVQETKYSSFKRATTRQLTVVRALE